MAVTIPFLTSETNYTLHCPLDNNYSLMFEVRWNSRDEAWYVDMYTDDGGIVSINEKLVVGAALGRLSRHPIFYEYAFRVVDMTGSGTDPGFDDLNSRVVLIVQTPGNVV
jgi:hypothetical protein